jgi:uroporphyrinogen-III decarboxylase
MRREQWDTFKAAAKLHRLDAVPVSLIVDSPWIPGYLGISHLDYYFDPEVWFQANLRIMQEFPEAILFPSWWAEYGMAIEPCALGGRACFRPDQPPSVRPNLLRLEDWERLAPVDPFTDGFMCMALHRYRTQRQRIREAGHVIPVATARGPLCTAAFVRGVTELMLDIADNPQAVLKLIAFVTETIIAWLKAQVEVIGEGAEGIFILDDIVGFLSRKQYLEFAHPYLKQICQAFPADWVRVYHNDARIDPFLEDLAEAGFDVINWSHNLDVAEVRRRIGGKMCLMGNVSPLEVATRATPQEVKASALEVLRKAEGRGMILSVGGGVSPGMPRANILALIEAAREFYTR